MLHDWWVKQINAFTAPECSKMVCGKVYGRPGFKDGQIIESSPIKDVKGRFVLTVTGSIYRLHGRPCKDYMKWMKEHGIVYDGFEPIKIRRV